MIRIDSSTGFSRGSRGGAAKGESDMMISIHGSEEERSAGLQVLWHSFVDTL